MNNANNNKMKTSKDLNKQLVSKNAGFKYVYEIENTRFEICEYNECRGWCLNTYELSCLGNMELKDSCGYEGFLLRDCKSTILSLWNSNEIK